MIIYFYCMLKARKKTNNCIFVCMIPFLELKIAKNGYYENGALFFAWDLGVIFLGIQIFEKFKILEKVF